MVLELEFRVKETIIGSTEELRRTHEFQFPGFHRSEHSSAQRWFESALHLPETLL